MNDNGAAGRPAFGFEDARQCRRIKRIRSQAIHRLRREGDQLSRTQQLRRVHDLAFPRLTSRACYLFLTCEGSAEFAVSTSMYTRSLGAWRIAVSVLCVSLATGGRHLRTPGRLRELPRIGEGYAALVRARRGRGKNTARRRWTLIVTDEKVNITAAGVVVNVVRVTTETLLDS